MEKYSFLQETSYWRLTKAATKSLVKDKKKTPKEIGSQTKKLAGKLTRRLIDQEKEYAKQHPIRAARDYSLIAASSVIPGPGTAIPAIVFHNKSLKKFKSSKKLLK